ncbi:ClC voltage-gated chloride channel protein [Ceratobasidium sp. AG-Ba]|nr:ClC voltage-gated chloride channel protein [Ceratobasidium sp. AG-Ba]
MAAPSQTPGFDDTWAQWDDVQQRQSKDVAPIIDPSGGQTSAFERIELSQDMDPWASEPWNGSARRSIYHDGTTIDWTQEEAAERTQKHLMQSQLGLRGIMLPLLDQSRVWMVLIATGISVGFVGAWLDVLVAWLGDIRTGRCSYGFFYNEIACCSGLDPGEECNEWNTWSQYLRIHSAFLTSLVQASTYVVLAVAYSGSAAILVQSYAPYAFHTGIPEIKAILNGYVLDLFLSPWTLLVKGIGLALAVASGLSLGKEYPNTEEIKKRRILSAAASAGVAVAFGSPLGGVLFGLEELDLFSRAHVMWRAFVCAVLAAVTLQWTDVFATGKLVLFQVTAGAPWRGFELVPWMILSVFGGLSGALLIKLNVASAIHRHRSWIKEWPLMEVVCVTAFTAVMSYPIAFMRVQSSELVANLFQECESTKPDYHGLCNPSSMWQNIFHLLLTCGLKLCLTAWTFGMKVPAGIFLPTIAVGATMGRAVGIIMQGWHRAHPMAWIFSACAPEGECISPGFYSVIGAAAMLGGVTRMTISLVVIMFELTGALSHVLPIMIAVMVSKWVGDAFGGKEGIYDAWIALHGYPFLSTTADYRDQGQTATSRMVRREHIVSIGAHHNTVEELEATLQQHSFRGFPVVNGEQLLGYITRDRLQHAIDILREQYPDESVLSDVNCTFAGRHETSYEEADLSGSLDPAPMQLRPGMPLQLVVSLFQKMNPQCVLFTSKGFLKGMMTKRDVVDLLRERFHDVHALSERPETIFDATAASRT